MRLTILLASLAFLMTSCAMNGMTGGTSAAAKAEAEAASKSPAGQIKSLTFINGGPPLPAQQRRDQYLRIDSDLNAKMEVKNGFNTVLSEKSGAITQAQFDAIVSKLNASNYIYLKPTKIVAVPGRGNKTLVVTSDLGAHRFVQGGSRGFAGPIAEIFAMKDQLLPE